MIGELDKLAWRRGEYSTPEQRLWFAVLWDALDGAIRNEAMRGFESDRDWWRKSPAVDDICFALGVNPDIYRRSAQYWWERADREGGVKAGAWSWIKKCLVLDVYKSGIRDLPQIAAKCMMGPDEAGKILRAEGLPYECSITYRKTKRSEASTGWLLPVGVVPEGEGRARDSRADSDPPGASQEGRRGDSGQG